MMKVKTWLKIIVGLLFISTIMVLVFMIQINRLGGRQKEASVTSVTGVVHEVAHDDSKKVPESSVEETGEEHDSGTVRCPTWTIEDEYLGKSRNRGGYAKAVPDDRPTLPKKSDDSNVGARMSVTNTVTKEVVTLRHGKVVIYDNHGNVTVNNYAGGSGNTDTQAKTNKPARITPEKPDRVENIISPHTRVDPGSELNVVKTVSRGNGTLFHIPKGWSVNPRILADKDEVERWVNVGSKSDPHWIVMGSEEEMGGKITRAEDYWIKLSERCTEKTIRVRFTLKMNTEE